MADPIPAPAPARGINVLSPPKLQGQPPKPPTLGQRKLNREDLARPILFGTIANTITYEDVMRPGFWVNHVEAFQRLPFGKVTLIREDGSMIVELVALEAKPGLVRMHCTYAFVDPAVERANAVTPAPEEEVEPPPGYKYAHAINVGHIVRLQETGDVIIRGYPNKPATIAAAWVHYKAANTLSTSGEAPKLDPAALVSV